MGVTTMFLVQHGGYCPNRSAMRYGSSKASKRLSPRWTRVISPKHREKRTWLIWLQAIIVFQLCIQQHSEAFTTSDGFSCKKTRPGGTLAFISGKGFSPTPFGLPHSNTCIKSPTIAGCPRNFMGMSASRIDDDGEDDVDNMGAEERLRKRDRIKDWLSQSTGSDSRSRIKTRFDSLFSGMPNVGDNLTEKSASATAESRNRQREDPTWFAEEKQQIMNSFENMLRDMLAQLEEQRREDPESVPENAEAIIKSVLKQEMDTEIERAREESSLERLNEYERSQRQSVEKRDITGPIDDEVQRLIDESEEEYSRQEASRLQLEEFLRYEDEAFSQAAKKIETDSAVVGPKGDLDAWALERLQEMAKDRQDVDGGEVVLDILDEITDDLLNRMEKEKAKKGAVRTETLKEWQMYRAIATKLNKQRDGMSREELASATDTDDEEIVRRLDSWKEYVSKEQRLRDEGGLSRTAKQAEEKVENAPRSDRESRAETRKIINKMSIEALESLMVTSDPARREKLRQEIQFLKAELEGKDYLDWEEPREDEPVAPVDMTGVFTSKDRLQPKPRPAEERRLRGGSHSEVDGSTFDSTRASPPNTQFFSRGEEHSSEAVPPTPKTPFFSDTEEAEEGYTPTVSDNSKLGSLEEQKLSSLYRRAGARTREEQDRVRSGWEEYQRLEKEKRRLSGLDESSDAAAEYSGSSKFNVSEVMKSDGDFDAERILSAIGPRPKRGTKRSTTGAVSLDKKSVSPVKQTPGEEEIASSLYRSVSAVGGGRFRDDPEGKSRDQAEFQSFWEKEKKMRQSLDEAPEPTNIEGGGEFDEEEYAEDVLSSLGPRPQPRRSRQVDPGELSDMGGVVSSDDEWNASGDEDEDEDEEDIPEDLVSGGGKSTSKMPGWLKRENEEAKSADRKRRTFLGEEVEDAFDDDQYEKNMRQLAEYERRRAGNQASMGIDISDVLGRRDVDDYKDYAFDEAMYGSESRGWGVASFDDRKRNLAEYTELDIAEVNSLMDHRDSVFSTGVSQYTRRINKPFEAFGAIFRLEGVFADLSGLHGQAWTDIAEKESLRPPNRDEIRRASVVHPAAAVKEVFVWTDDFLEATRLAGGFRESFGKYFDVWAEENNLLETVEETPSATERGSLAIGEDVFDDPRPAAAALNLPQNEGELLELLFRVWSHVAFEKNKPVPTNAQIQQAALVPPDIAIQEVFEWTHDPREAGVLQTKFQILLRKLSGNGQTSEEKQGPTKSSGSSGSQSQPTQTGLIDEASMMEAHYLSWTAVAEEFDFERPTSDEVLGAFVLNDPYIAARDGFGWTYDEAVLSKVVETFYKTLKEVISERSGSRGVTAWADTTTSGTSTAGPQSSESPSPISCDDGESTYEEVLEMNQKAWNAAAASHGFNPPPDEFVKLSLDTDPEDVIIRIFRWTWEAKLVKEIAQTFRDKLKAESEAFATKYHLSLENTAHRGNGPDSGETVSNDDLFQAAFDAWTKTAEIHNLTHPTREQVVFAMSVGPEEAIAGGFEWTADREAAWWIMETYKENIQAERERLGLDELEETTSEGKPEEKPAEDPLVTMIQGAHEWVKSLREYEMQCGVISHLNKGQVAAILKFTQLDDLFDADVRVTSNNGYKSDSQQMLGAALRLERKPDHCVVFDSSPYASVAAHEVDMRSVGLIGSYPRYELLSADTTASGFQELTAFNIRRLFGERIFDQPELDQQQADPNYQKKVRTKFDWGDD